MAFTVQQDYRSASEIIQDDLKHHYYVQLTPDGQRLVPGLLQQKSKGLTGNWLDVANVDRDFPVRYFVQYTDFNTLVPGSLIQATRQPQGMWKEVKKHSTLFHRVVFNNPYSLNYLSFSGDTSVTTNKFSTQDDFINDRVTGPLEVIYPNIPEYTTSDILYKLPYSKKLFFNLYYFKGTFNELNRDVTKLIPFTSDNSFYIVNNIDVPQPNTNMETWLITLNSLVGKSSAPNGSYSVVLEMLDVSSLGKEYVVLENVLVSTTTIIHFG